MQFKTSVERFQIIYDDNNRERVYFDSVVIVLKSRRMECATTILLQMNTTTRTNDEARVDIKTFNQE